MSSIPSSLPDSEPPRYVDLQDDFFKNSTWSNDPADLKLDTYFHPQKPSLGKDFGIQGLRPVIKELEEEIFLLTDDTGNFYMWQPEGGNLFRIRVDPNADAKTAAETIMNGVGDDKLVQMFNPRY